MQEVMMDRGCRSHLCVRNSDMARDSSPASIVPERSMSNLRKMPCHCSTYLKMETNL